MRTTEIRDQVYDEKQNAVKITVVSCCPEKIQKKIRSKGGNSVEKIEIVSGDKKKEGTEKKKEGAEKAKEGAGEKKKDEAEKKGKGKEDESKKKEGGGDKPKDKEPEKKPVPVLVSGHPSIFPPVYPVQGYYNPYHQLQVVGGSGPVPCYQCHGVPGHHGAWDGNRVYNYGSRSDYFSEENPTACTVM